MASSFAEDVVPETSEDTGRGRAGVEEEVKADIVIAGDGVMRDSLPAQTDPKQFGMEGGILAEIDAKNFRVMRGRGQEKPKRKTVDSIRRAIQAGRPVERVIIYQDKNTGDKYSPNGGHRQQAYDELGLPVPVIIYTVPDAKERAEMESCYANEGNGASRSDHDVQFQAGKACDILQEKLGRPPKPKELAEATHTSSKFARSHLRKLFTPTLPNLEEPEEEQASIPSDLQAILNSLKKIKLPEEWEPGDASKPILKQISKEVRRIASKKRPDPAVGIDKIKAFMDEHSLSNTQMAKLSEITHPTITRWLKGKSKISESNARILRQVLSFTSEHIATILEEDEGGRGKREGDE